jgi:putative MATE family efflux protein
MTARSEGSFIPDRLRTVLDLSLPIVGGMASQNVLNLVDIAMVGALGPAALAAVGLGSFANFMAMALVMGLSSGVQAMAARRKGEGRESEMAVALNGGLVLAILIGLPALVVLLWLAPSLYALLIDDPAVIAEGVPYFEARLCGIFAIGVNFAFRGFWNGISLSRVYLRVVLIMHISNVPISYVLIFGLFDWPGLGTVGAGIGTTVALYIGSACYIWVGVRRARPFGFLRGLPDIDTMATMLRLALPASLQMFLFATGITVLFWIIGQVGTIEVAAANVMINLLLVAYLPGNGLGLAAASLVGQALGRGDSEDAHRWGWDVVKLGVAMMGTLGLLGIAFPSLLLSGFLHDPAVIAGAKIPLQLVGASMVWEAVTLVLMNALLGAGAARQVMIISVGTQWLLGLPLSWLAGPHLGYGLLGIWVCQVGYRALQAGIFAVMWNQRGWAKIEV